MKHDYFQIKHQVGFDIIILKQLIQSYFVIFPFLKTKGNGEVITQNDIDQAWAESHFKYVTDEIAFRLDAQAQGKEEGLKEGEELANYQMAKKNAE